MKRLALAVALLGLAFAPDTASAQDKYPSKTGEDRRAVRSGRRDRHHVAAVRRATQEHPRPVVRGREQARRLRHRGDRGNGALEARRPHALCRQRLDQCHHAGAVQEEVLHRLREGRGVGLPARDLSVLPRHHDGEFRHQERARTWSPTPRRTPASCATPAPASAASRTSIPRFSQGAPASR